MNYPFIDFHCHPHLKPYGRSFKNKQGQNSFNHKHQNSIWYYDPPNSLIERFLQLLAGISKFTQADCTTLAYGNVRIICASLYPIEKGFFVNKLDTQKISDNINDFITGVSRQRVDYIQNINNYFDDLLNEYNFYLQLHDHPVTIANNTYRYKLVSSFAEVESFLSQNPYDESTIFILLSIEGLHVLNNNLSKPPERESILKNIQIIKEWMYPPFFVTVAHHFFNHLCGHARSLTGITGKFLNQDDQLNTSFLPLGHEVVEAALDKTKGKRILIDVKHMSILSRKEYYYKLNSNYADENIPIIVSHGACNGLRSYEQQVVDGKNTGYKMLPDDINFFDEEILAIAISKGIFCLQLDERRIANSSTLKATKHSLQMNKIRHYRAELLWNQIQHIAELLDRHDLFAWDCIAIGSDFDGIINPLNGFLTSESIPHLISYLERYVFNYMNGQGSKLKNYNQLSPSEIVNRIFATNGYDFLRRNF